MPRNPEQNEELRENRKKQILDAALTVYTRYGYHGADMDVVSKEAKLAKGLVYYYYKTKKELFIELFTWMLNEGCSLSDSLLENTKSLRPVEQLMNYVYGIFAANKDNPRIMQFNIRMPFDAYTVFGSDGWNEGAQKSAAHKKALTDIIEDAIAQNFIPDTNPGAAANSFWSVFVANVFEYSKLMMGEQERDENIIEAFRNVVQFCFQGLGVEYSVWHDCLEKVVRAHNGGDCVG